MYSSSSSYLRERLSDADDQLLFLSISTGATTSSELTNRRFLRFTGGESPRLLLLFDTLFFTRRLLLCEEPIKLRFR